MRIERLEAMLVNVPLHVEQRTSFRTRRAMTQCLVRATAACGRVGWGEASGGTGGWVPACGAIVEAMQDVVVGRAPGELAAIRATLFDARYWKNTGRLAHPSFAAVETALLDLEAQRREVPLWRLLGEKRRDGADGFAFLDLTLPVAELARQAGEAAARGFRVLYATVPIAAEGQQFMGAHLADDVLEGGPLVPVGQPIAVPEGPGLGAPVSEAKVRELQQRYRIEGNAKTF